MKQFLTLILFFTLMLVACGSPAVETDTAVVEEQPVAESAVQPEVEEEPDTSEEPAEVDSNDSESASEPAGEVEVSESVAEDQSDEMAGATELSDELLALLPPFDPADIQETESGLRYVIIEEGEGDLPAAGDGIQAHYTGYLVNGEKFDSSRDRGTTFEFPLGQRRVIQGWDEGFALMKPGTKALLIIPPDLGYGPQGSPPAIPGGSTLVFDVELVNVLAVRKPIEVAEEDYTVTDGGLKYADLTAGEGASPQDGEVVSINFALWDSVTGEMFGNSDQNGEPLSFALGREVMFTGLEEGIRSMQVGGSRQLVLEGDALEGSGLPPVNPIIFEIELVSVAEGPPAEFAEIADDQFTTTEDGTRWADITVGDGAVLEVGQVALVEYTLWLADGQQLDSSLFNPNQEPIEFPLGLSQFPGWNDGLNGIAVGGKRQVVVPADVVGDIGFGEPQDLVFEVEVLEISGQ